MWAHWLVWQGGKLEGEVRQHLEAAARSPREHPWLRRMQFAIASLRGELNGYALDVLNQMRAAGEQPDASQRDFAWRRLIDGGLLASEAEREQLLGFVGPADALATVEWLYPQEQLAPERRPLHRFALALLRARAGRQEEALAALGPTESVAEVLDRPEVDLTDGVVDEFGNGLVGHRRTIDACVEPSVRWEIQETTCAVLGKP